LRNPFIDCLGGILFQLNSLGIWMFRQRQSTAYDFAFTAEKYFTGSTWYEHLGMLTAAAFTWINIGSITRKITQPPYSALKKLMALRSITCTSL
ncbi:MAG: hypothetical protein ABR574_04150, partial [Cryomorphaceae bacterium]